MDIHLKKIIKNSSIIFFGNSMSSVLSLVAFTIVAKQLGPASLAIIVLAQTYALIFNDVFNIQTWESMIKFGSGKDGAGLFNVVKTNLLMDLGSAIIAVLLALVLVVPVGTMIGWDESYYSVITLYCLSILFNITSFTIGIPRLFDKFSSIAKIQVFVAASKLAAVVAAWTYSNELITYVYIYLVSDIMTNLLLITYSACLMRDNFHPNWWKTKISLDKTQLRFIWWTNLRTIIRIPVRHFDIIVISMVLTIEAVGIYKVYKEVAGIIGRVGEPINQSIYPEFTKLLVNKQIRKAAKVLKMMIAMLFVVGAVITLILALSSELLIGRFFGVEYLSEIYALYLLMALFGLSFVVVPINALFIAAGFAKYSFLIVLFTNTVYLFTAYQLGSTLGMYGVILAFGVQMFLNQGLKIWLLKKHSSEWGGLIK